MGIKGLKKIIKEHSSIKHLESYRFKTVAIDTSIFLYKFKYSGNLLGRFLNQIIIFKKYNINAIYIFDGEPPLEKQKILNDRRQKKVISITKDDVENVQKLLMYTGTKYIQAKCEAEKYCAFLTIKGLADIVLSNDTDTLIFGGKVLLSDLQSDNTCEEYVLDNILNKLEIDMNKLVDLAILCGCDYYPKGIYRVGPKKALQMVKEFSTIEDSGLQIPEDMNLSNLRYLFKNDNEMVLPCTVNIVDKYKLIKFIDDNNVSFSKNIINKYLQ